MRVTPSAKRSQIDTTQELDARLDSALGGTSAQHKRPRQTPSTKLESESLTPLSNEAQCKELIIHKEAFSAFWKRLGTEQQRELVNSWNAYRTDAAGKQDLETFLHLAARYDHLEAMEALIALNPNLLMTLNSDGQLPIHAALFKGKFNAVMELLKYTPPEKIITSDNHKRNILHLAALAQTQTESFAPQIIELLLTLPNVSHSQESLSNAQDENGRTPLRCVVANQYMSLPAKKIIIEALILAGGADVTIHDFTYQQTPVSYLTHLSKKKPEEAKILKKHIEDLLKKREKEKNNVIQPFVPSTNGQFATVWMQNFSRGLTCLQLQSELQEKDAFIQHQQAEINRLNALVANQAQQIGTQAKQITMLQATVDYQVTLLQSRNSSRGPNLWSERTTSQQGETAPPSPYDPEYSYKL